MYKEDFDKFVEGLQDVVSFIKQEQGEAPQREERKSEDFSSESSSNEESKPKSFFDRFKL